MGMLTEKNVFIEDEQLPWQAVGEGVRRKIVAYDKQLMMVKVAFETGGVGAVHEHYHSQITHIESGKFEIEIGGEKKILSAGDAYYIPPHVLHGALCLQAGVLIDVFSPMREDFL